MASIHHDLDDTDVEKSSADFYDEKSSVYVVDPEAEKRLLRRLDMRVIPSAMILYFLSFLDRSNIGNAKTLNQDTGDDLQTSIGLTNQSYTTALMVFLVAYLIFETPSNYILKAFRPSRWMAILLFGWGSMTMCLGAANNYETLTAVRFLLGMFEAGMAPGLFYFLTFWYKPNERAIRIAVIISCGTIAGAFGGAIAYGVGHMNGVGGLQAWRWLFIIEGIPSVILAFFVLAFFPDYPETVRWLDDDERELATERLKGLASLGHAKITWAEAKETLKEWRLYIHYTLYICLCVPFSSISLFSPTIISGLGYKGLDAQLFTIPPYAIAFVVTVAVALVSDRYEMRSIATALCFFIAGIAFIVEGVLPTTAFQARYGLLCVAVSFSFAILPPILSWLTANLKTTGAATLGVPMCVSVGQIGQIIGVYIYKAAEAPKYPTGHFTNAAFSLLGAVLVLVLRVFYIKWNRALGPNERKWAL